MPRRKPSKTVQHDDDQSPRKRPRQDEAIDHSADDQGTPSKRRRSRKDAAMPAEVDGEGALNGHLEPASATEDAAAETPTRRKPGRPKGSGTRRPVNPGAQTQTPSKSRVKTLVETPVKANGTNGAGTPGRRNFADRSARRKSARALIERVVAGNTSDDEAGDEHLVRAIYESSEAEDEDREVEEEPSDLEEEGLASEAATPSKTPRGRKKKATRKKSPTPPRDLPPHEQYFYDNRPGLTKTSHNTLSGLDLLTHDEYFSLLHDHKDRHLEDVAFLQSLHAKSFPQWAFELSQGFSLCLYGYGSKRALLHELATHLYHSAEDHQSSKIVVVNGYVRTTTIREILSTTCNAVDRSQKIPSSNPVAMVDELFALLSAQDVELTLIINSVDAPPLRRHGVQSILAQLASHPKVHLICSADTPDFALMWDTGLRSAFEFVFHDCTTFSPFAAEIDVVDDVHELLGRKSQRVGGKEGVAFVLKSLTSNAKNLFKLLLMEVLTAMDEEYDNAAQNPGVEYRMLYNKAVEEFITTNEVGFRTLLKEFYDHQMIISRKDVIGTELLSAPFRKDEMEAILEDIDS